MYLHPLIFFPPSAWIYNCDWLAMHGTSAHFDVGAASSLYLNQIDFNLAVCTSVGYFWPTIDSYCVRETLGGAVIK